MRPVGSEPARVYWVRRLVVLAVLVVVLIGAGFLISGVFGSSDDADPEPTAAPTKTEEVSSPDAACDPKDLSLTLNDPAEEVEAGKEAAFDVGVTNNSADPCTVDVGDESRVLTITSGSDRIWSSADCPSEDDDSRLVLLRPGSAKVNTVIWDGKRSDEKCDSDLPQPRTGTYKLEVEMEDVESVEHSFNIS
ncbi:MAG TPA: hypothetical protein VK096_05700 [Actinomycetales bacterium]|nr:hypothetical protein [Actinomycetales bacterium]